MVHEGITWFTAQGDAGLLVSPIEVNPAAATAAQPAPASQPATAPAAVPASVAPATAAPTPVAAPAAAPAPAQVEIQNVIDQLARHPSKQYTTRALGDIRRIIIHHTATPATVTVDRIAQFLVSNRDLPGITYHFCITAEGVAYQTQPLVVTSVHAGQDSRDSVGVCLIGNFTGVVPPQAQLYATASVLAQLLSTINLPPGQILGYNEIASTASPGNTWPTWKPSLLAQVQAFLRGATPATPAPSPTTPAPSPTAPTPSAPATPAAVDKPIDHYLLLWHKGPGDWAEWSLRAAFDYLERFPVTIGFSVEEAKRAKYVTILGGPEGTPASVEPALQAAGCKVERLTGATETETRQILRELARQGKRFQQLR
jgi:N-acetylmuramoyl-L-alanine amidase